MHMWNTKEADMKKNTKKTLSKNQMQKLTGGAPSLRDRSIDERGGRRDFRRR